MKEVALDVLTAAQSASVDRIKAYHAASLKAFGDHMGYVFLTGAEMNALKDSSTHGTFEGIREKYFPQIPKRSACRYMLFAEGLSKSATVALLPTVGEQKLLTNGELSEKQRETILKAVHKAADGKSITELYRDLGVIRPKEKPAYHPPKKLSPEEQLAAENEQAEAQLIAVENAVRLAFDDLNSKTGTLSVRIKSTRWKEHLALLRQYSKAVAPLTKRKSAK